MKTNIYKSLLLSACLLTLGSCKEDGLDLYDSDSSVFFTLQRWDLSGGIGSDSNVKFPFEYDGKTYDFEWGTYNRTVFDELRKSFYFDPADVTKDTVFIPLSIMGFPMDADRDVKFAVKSGNAQEGIHYNILDSYIPAGKTRGAIVVEVLRAGLSDNVTRHIDFSIEPNENFATRYKTIDRSSTSAIQASVLDFRLVISNDVLAPLYWPLDFIWENYLGKYSKKKFLLILELTGGNPYDFSPDNILDLLPVSKLMGYGSILKSYLNEQSAAGTPVLEEDGTPMQAGQYS